MDQLEEKAQRVNAALRQAVGMVELSEVSPAGAVTPPITDEEWIDRILALLATESFDVMSWPELHELSRPLADEPPPDSDEGLKRRAARIVREWLDQTQGELFHLWHMRHDPYPWYGNKDLTDKRRVIWYEGFALLDANAGTAYYSEAAKRFAAWLKCGSGCWRDPRFVEAQMRLLARATDYASLPATDDESV